MNRMKSVLSTVQESTHPDVNVGDLLSIRRRKMPTSNELQTEAKYRLYEALGIEGGTVRGIQLSRAIDYIIEAAVMETLEKMKGHGHFDPSKTLFR
jgi:hypothetical protein